MPILDPILKPLIRSGSLSVIDWKGREVCYGDGIGVPITIRIHDRVTGYRLLLDPQLETGEAYMSGRLTMEKGTIFDFLDLIFRNIGLRSLNYPMRGLAESVRSIMRLVHQYNPIWRSRYNAQHHYDLSDDLYESFLDSDRQYSCGYFISNQDSLEIAQQQKKSHIASKLLLRKGHKVLDIGSGWGGLALYLSSTFQTDVTGLTLSTEQFSASNRRVSEANLEEHVRFKLLDYRQEEGCYDRIVSVGMFEHVGVTQYGIFFRKIRSLLRDEGVALLHSIARPDGPGHTNPWIKRHIFPGGYIPSLSETIAAIEASGLLVTDVEIIRLHYAETLRHWRERFWRNAEKIRKVYDDRFFRMWEFYLITSELAFRYQGMIVFQIQLAKRHDVVPITRDYMNLSQSNHPFAFTSR